MDDKILYVENIPPDSTEDSLLHDFKSFGQIKKIDLPKFDPNHPLCKHAQKPRCKGYALVEFSTEYEARQAYNYYKDLSNFSPKDDLKERLEDGGQPSQKRARLSLTQSKATPWRVIQMKTFLKLKQRYKDQRLLSIEKASKLIEAS